jgi:hypothetical protein
MSQLMVNCPGCSQPLQCESEWVGQTIQCPACQASLVVPAPPPSPSKSIPPTKHVPGASKPKSGKGAGKKKSAGMKKNLAILVTVLVCGLAGFFGFKALMHYQNKMNAADERERSLSGGGGGEAAHAVALNDVLDATDPNKFSRLPSPERSLPELDESTTRFGGLRDAVAVPTNDLPVIPASYTLDIASAKIPEGKAAGKISGTNFIHETAKLETGATSRALRIRQGNPLSPDLEVIVYLKLKPGESPAGKTWTVAKEDRSKDVASVSKLWKPNPKYAAKRKDYFNGYALKLELAAMGEGVLKGKIYLAMPDPEQTVVAGVFYAEASDVAAAAVTPAGDAGILPVNEFRKKR